MPESKPLHAMSDEELEHSNQGLMRDRAAILARQRDLSTEMDRRAKRRRVDALQAAMTEENGPQHQSVSPDAVVNSPSVLPPGG